MASAPPRPQPTGQHARQGQQELAGELVLPVLAVALAVYYFISVRPLPWIARAHGVVVGSSVAVLVAVLAGRLALQARRGQLTWSTARLAQRLGLDRLDRWLLVAWMLGVTALLPYAGFTLAVVVFLLACLWTLGVRRPRELVLIPVLTALAGYLFFVALLHVKLPHGPAERWLGRLLGL